MTDDEASQPKPAKAPLLTPSATQDPSVAGLPEGLRDGALAREPFSLCLAPGRFALLMVPALLIALGIVYRQGFRSAAPILALVVAILVVLIGAVLDRRIDVDEEGLAFVPMLPIRPRQRFPYSAFRPFEHYEPITYGHRGGPKQRAVITDPAYRYKVAGLFPRDKLETASFYGLSHRGPALSEDELIASLDAYHPRGTGSGARRASTLPADLDEVRASLRALDQMVSGAKPLRDANTVGVSAEISDVGPAVGFQAIALGRTLAIYREHREKEGAPPLGDAAHRPDDGFLEPAETLNDLIFAAQPAWEGTAKVHDGKGLTAAFARLRAWMEPSLTEVEEYRRLYPGLQEQRPTREPADVSDAEPPEPSDVLDAIEALVDLVNEAQPVLLTGQIRINPAHVTALTSRMRAALPQEFDAPAEIEAKVDEIDALVRGAGSVPFSSTVRIDREKIYDLVIETLETYSSVIRPGHAG